MGCPRTSERSRAAGMGGASITRNGADQISDAHPRYVQPERARVQARHRQDVLDQVIELTRRAVRIHHKIDHLGGVKTLPVLPDSGQQSVNDGERRAQRVRERAE